MSTPLYKRVGRNPTPGGRDIIAGDIHGCFEKMREALHAVNFSVVTGDRLFLVGDLVDRGPQSAYALQWLAQPGIHAVRGNHEQMAIEWAAGTYDDERNYVSNGGAWFMALSKSVQRTFADVFDALPYAIELETEAGLVGIVHAECPFPQFRMLEAELAGEPSNRFFSVRDCCIWSRGRIECQNADAVSDVRAVVVGHTPMESWTSLGNHIYIDTMGWRGRQFTLLDAATLQPIKYSNIE